MTNDFGDSAVLAAWDCLCHLATVLGKCAWAWAPLFGSHLCALPNHFFRWVVYIYTHLEFVCWQSKRLTCAEVMWELVLGYGRSVYIVYESSQVNRCLMRGELGLGCLWPQLDANLSRFPFACSPEVQMCFDYSLGKLQSQNSLFHN
jgi:hypothetical protein